MLKKDSELQQKESILLAAQQALEETRQRAESAKATLRSEQNTFEETTKCPNDDLSREHIALDEAESREYEAIADCQYAPKVFKFKKYKEGYKEGKCGASPKYSLDIGSFPKGKG